MGYLGKLWVNFTSAWGQGKRDPRKQSQRAQGKEKEVEIPEIISVDVPVLSFVECTEKLRSSLDNIIDRTPDIPLFRQSSRKPFESGQISKNTLASEHEKLYDAIRTLHHELVIHQIASTRILGFISQLIKDLEELWELFPRGTSCFDSAKSVRKARRERAASKELFQQKLADQFQQVRRLVARLKIVEIQIQRMHVA